MLDRGMEQKFDNPDGFLAPASPNRHRRSAVDACVLIRRVYFEADSAPPATAWPAARRAVSTRNGEQLT
jgi:hypothetical protein